MLTDTLKIMGTDFIQKQFYDLGKTTPPEPYSSHGRDNYVEAKKSNFEQKYATYNANQQDYRNFLLAEYSYAKSQEQADLAYERNSPAAQKARMLAAGYNPTLSNTSDSGYSAATFNQPSAASRANVGGPRYQTFTEQLAKINGIISTMNQAVGLQTQQLQNDILKQNIFRNAQVNQREEIDTLDTLLSKGWMKDKEEYAFMRSAVDKFKAEQVFNDTISQSYSSAIAKADATARHNFYGKQKHYDLDYDLEKLEKAYKDQYDELLNRKPNRDLDLSIKREANEDAQSSNRFRKDAIQYLDDHPNLPIELRIILLGAIQGLSKHYKF